VLAAVVNVSEGRRPAALDALQAACGDDLLDLHADPWHNRSVWTLVGADAARRLAAAAVRVLDLRRHRGVHPRLGVVDVVPFVPVGVGDSLDAAVEARDAYAAWSPVPCLRYGPGCPTLPELRRSFRTSGVPPHPTAGLTAVGARPPLVAYNLWLERGASVRTARGLAAMVRGPSVRALGLAVGHGVQVSMNLVDPLVVGPADVYDAVAARARVGRAELVGLLPAAVLASVPPERWEQLDLGPDRTLESRLTARSGRDSCG